MHQQTMAKLSNMEDLVQQFHASVVHFSKERDIQQTANLLRQCVDENLQNPEQQCASAVEKVPGDQPADDEVCKFQSLLVLICRAFEFDNPLNWVTAQAFA